MHGRSMHQLGLRQAVFGSTFEVMLVADVTDLP